MNEINEQSELPFGWRTRLSDGHKEKKSQIKGSFSFDLFYFVQDLSMYERKQERKTYNNSCLSKVPQ